MALSNQHSKCMEKEESKKGFVLYTDIIHTVKKMPIDKAGKLFLTILEYTNGNETEIDDLLVEVVFEPIKQQLIRDHKKYLKVVERNRANGAKGGRPKEPKKPSGLISEPKKPENDTDNGTENDTDNGTEIDFNSKSHYSEKLDFNNNSESSNKDPKKEKEKKSFEQKREKEVVVGWHNCIALWIQFYESKFNSKPTFGPVEGKHFKSILTRLGTRVKNKNEEWNEETGPEYLKDFLVKAWNHDNWLKENFLILNLSSKFDAIINKKQTTETISFSINRSSNQSNKIYNSEIDEPSFMKNRG